MTTGSDAKPTAVSRRCPRCEELYDTAKPHRCPASGEGAGEPDGADDDSASASGGVSIHAENVTETDDLVGAIIGDRYELLGHLSSGGMGMVYRARHILLDTQVAIKILLKPKDLDAQRRFLFEAQIASKIQHPNTVYISDFGLLPDGRSYIVMELLRGKTLSDAIAETAQKPRRGMEPVRALNIAVQIARGLQAVHDKGIVHRDLKPDNIFLLEQDGQSDFVKIVDFGIAVAAGASSAEQAPIAFSAANLASASGIQPALSRGSSDDISLAFKQRHTLPGMVLGTPHYISPEQAMGAEIDARADQYALGCILYEMLTGEAPFDEPNVMAVLFKQAHVPVPPPNQRFPELKLPLAVEQLVLKSLAKKAEARFPTMRDLEAAILEELDRLGGDLPTFRRRPSSAAFPTEPRTLPGDVAVPPTLNQPLPAAPPAPAVVAPLYRRRFFAPVLAAALLAAGGIGTGVYLYRRAHVEASTDQLLAFRAAAIEQLKSELGSADPELRLGALTALSGTMEPDLLARITPLLSDGDPAVQLRAAEVLGQLGQQGAVAPLSALLDQSLSKAPLIGAAAAEALDQLGNARGRSALTEAENGKHDAARVRAALYLLGTGDREARKLLSAVIERGKLADEARLLVLGRLSQAGEAAASEQLSVLWASVAGREQQLPVAAALARIADARGRDWLREQAGRPSPLQLRAAAVAAQYSDATDGAPLAALFRSLLKAKTAGAPVRQLAISGLGYVGGKPDLEDLLTLLRSDSEPRIRQAAATAIVRITDADPAVTAAQNLSWAQVAASDPNQALREQAVAVLGDLHGEGAVAALGQILTRPDAAPSDRRAAARALGNQQEPAALRILSSRVSEPDAQVRTEVLRSIAAVSRRIGSRLPAASRAELSQTLSSVVEKGSGEEKVLARSALLSAGDQGQRAPLQEALARGEEPVRRLVVEQTRSDAELLAPALADASPSVRRLAARRLAALGDKRAVAVLREELEDPKAGPASLSAYALLRRLGETVTAPPAAAPAEATTSDDPALRSAAISAAAAGDPVAARALVEQIALEPSPRKRRQALETAEELSEGGGPQLELAKSVAERLSRDSDAMVRARARSLRTRLARAEAATRPTESEAVPAEKPAKTVVVNAPAPPSEPVAQVKPSGEASPTGSKPEAGAGPDLTGLLRSGSQGIEKKDYRRAQRTLEKINALCAREPSRACAAMAYEVSYYLGRAYEGQGQLSTAMSEYQKLAELRAGSATQRSYVTNVIGELGKRLGRVTVKKLQKGRCVTTTLWVTPGEQHIKVSDDEMRSVNVQPGKQATVEGCK